MARDRLTIQMHIAAHREHNTLSHAVRSDLRAGGFGSTDTRGCSGDLLPLTAIKAVVTEPSLGKVRHLSRARA